MDVVVIAKLLNDGTGYEVFSPDLAGCQCKANSIDSGLVLMKQVIEEHLLLLMEYGEPFPHIKKIDEHVNKAIATQGVMLLITIDDSSFLGKSHKINVTLPELLIKKIDNCVAKTPSYKTRSGFLAQAAINELQRKEIAKPY